MINIEIITVNLKIKTNVYLYIYNVGNVDIGIEFIITWLKIVFLWNFCL